MQCRNYFFVRELMRSIAIILKKRGGYLCDKLRHLLQGVNNSTDSVTDSAEMLKEQAEQTRLSIQQVADSAVHMADGMDKQVQIVTVLQDNCSRMRHHMHILHADANNKLAEMARSLSAEVKKFKV